MFEFKIWVLVSQTINFFVLFWILKEFLFHPISRILDERQHEIDKMKEDTTLALDEAKRLKDECQSRLNNIKDEMDELKRQKLLEAEDSVAKVVVNAKNKAETMKEEAELEILLERQKAWVELRSDVVDIATKAVEKIIGESLNDTMHKVLINRTIEKLEYELPNSKMALVDNKTQLPKEYAENLFGKIDERELKPIYADFRAFFKLYNENKELHEVIDSPTVPNERKISLIHSVFASSMQKDTMDFIVKLINEKRIHLLDKIADEADKMYHDRKCIKGIRIRTKVPLTKQEMDRLQRVLSNKFGAIEVEEIVDPDMIGGVIVQLDDLVVDDSVDSKVKELRESMDKAKDAWKQQIADNPGMALF